MCHDLSYNERASEIKVIDHEMYGLVVSSRNIASLYKIKHKELLKFLDDLKQYIPSIKDLFMPIYYDDKKEYIITQNGFAYITKYYFILDIEIIGKISDYIREFNKLGNKLPENKIALDDWWKDIYIHSP